MSTRAIKYLKQKGIPFEAVTYDHQEKGAEFAARATGFPLEQTVKTLVVELERNNYCLVLMPGNRQLNLKYLAKNFAVKRTAIVDTTTAERLTGYLIGGISPFGTKQRLTVVMEKSIQDYDLILINAGQRGMMLKMAPEDIVNGLDCRVAAISR
jgi:Cys-tRNA(Pro)/Cys-tRNA(Cys) deacylase